MNLWEYDEAELALPAVLTITRISTYNMIETVTARDDILITFTEACDIQKVNFDVEDYSVDIQVRSPAREFNLPSFSSNLCPD